MRLWTSLRRFGFLAPAVARSEEDPASLTRLVDIAMPPPVPWWPPAPGWYVIGALALACLPPVIVTALSSYRRNAYRRAAIAELESVPRDKTAPGAIAALLKRTAMAAVGRTAVAPLSGRDWLDWLNARLSRPVFTAHAAEMLTVGLYRPGPAPSQETIAELRQLACLWIRRHR
jgi:hypothetical protein